MAKQNKPKSAATPKAEAQESQGQAVKLVAVRLGPDSPYGRVVVGEVVVERSKRPEADWPMIPAEELERLAEEYGLEAVPADEE